MDLAFAFAPGVRLDEGDFDDVVSEPAIRLLDSPSSRSTYSDGPFAASPLGDDEANDSGVEYERTPTPDFSDPDHDPSSPVEPRSISPMLESDSELDELSNPSDPDHDPSSPVEPRSISPSFESDSEPDELSLPSEYRINSPDYEPGPEQEYPSSPSRARSITPPYEPEAPRQRPIDPSLGQPEENRRRLEELRAQIENLRQSRVRLAEQIRRARASREQVEWLFEQRGEQRESPPFLFGDPPRGQLRQDQPLFFDPYDDGAMPQPDRRRIDRLQVPEDDLVEMEVERVRERRRPAAPQVIDLTEEPDSPRQQTLTLPDQPRFMRQAARPGPPHHLHRDPQRNQNQNPRRHMSQNHRTPSLTRSDGSLLGPAGGVPVIDLTDDSPGLPEPRHNARNHARPRQGRQRNHVQAEEEPADLFRPLAHQIPGRQHIGFALVQEFRRFNHLFGAPDVEVEILGHNPPPHLLPVMENNPLADNPVNFNYQANGFNRNAAPPKPVHVPPPAARSGFTRATGEDLAVICPSCEQELKYDPNADESPPAKRARSRKDREEHHFWAIKACGHVYCKNCYEHRKSTAKSSVKTTFRVAPGRKVLCAVDDCDSDVVNKGSWVGIFL